MARPRAPRPQNPPSPPPPPAPASLPGRAPDRAAEACASPPDQQGHFVYVLVCADGTLYTGYTVDVARRLAQHQAGTASKYTRARRPVSLRGFWDFGDRKSALQAEHAFKKLSRREKLAALAAETAVTVSFARSL
jgi:putative endonuclease